MSHFASDYRPGEKKVPKITRVGRKTAKTKPHFARQDKMLKEAQLKAAELIHSGVFGSSDLKDFQVSLSGNLVDPKIDGELNMGQQEYLYINIVRLPKEGT